MKQKDVTMQNYIDSLRKLLSAANHHSLFESDGRGAEARGGAVPVPGADVLLLRQGAGQ